MIQICSHNDCTACQACLNICSRNAISFEPDSIGCLFPTINQAKCVDCGLCVKICPSNNPQSLFPMRNAYVGCANDINEQKTSTSGGISAVISRRIVCKGGVVYGSTSLNPFDIHHIRIDKEENLFSIKGSKYVQSKIGRTFTMVRNDLKENRTVFFIGTPCQIAGLKNYLGCEYDNLFTADFVCHGVPPQKIFSDSLRLYVKKDLEQGCSVDFRFKNLKGKTSYGMFVRDLKGNTLLKEKFPENYYILGFLKGLFYRNNCYSCKYACPERIADITLGDYKDEEKRFMSIPHCNWGLSKILVNTYKGEKLLKECSSELILKPIDINLIIQSGGQLMHPMPKHKEASNFRELYLKHGILRAYQDILPPIIKQTRRSLFMKRISLYLKHNPIIKIFLKVRHK